MPIQESGAKVLQAETLLQSKSSLQGWALECHKHRETPHKGGVPTGQILQVSWALVLAEGTDGSHSLLPWYLGPYQLSVPRMLWRDIFTASALGGGQSQGASEHSVHISVILLPCVASQGSSQSCQSSANPTEPEHGGLSVRFTQICLCGIAVPRGMSWSKLPQRAGLQQSPQQSVSSSQLSHPMFLTRLKPQSLPRNKRDLSLVLRICLIWSFSLCSESLPKGKPTNSWWTPCCSQSWLSSLFSSG